MLWIPGGRTTSTCHTVLAIPRSALDRMFVPGQFRKPLLRSYDDNNGDDDGDDGDDDERKNYETVNNSIFLYSHFDNKLLSR